MEVDAEVRGSQLSGKPPKAPTNRQKRHSLQTGESITRFNKLTRHSSQPKLRRDDGVISGSLTNLSLDNTRRASSLAHLNRSLRVSGKTLSASNLAALSDTNLSLKEAVPPRSYDQPNSSFAGVKRQFEDLVLRYFYQMTEGCGQEGCMNRFCFSGALATNFTPQLAAIVSIELASRNRKYFCVEGKKKPLPEDLFAGEPEKPRPFLHCLFSTTPFQTLFSRLQDEVGLAGVGKLMGSQTSLRNSQSSLYQLGHDRSLSRSSLTNHSNPDIFSTELREIVCGQFVGKTRSYNHRSSRESIDRLPDGPVNGVSDSAEVSSTSSQKFDSKGRHLNSPLNFDTEFSKVNLSGNLVTNLSDMPNDLFGSSSSLNEFLNIEDFEKECALEMSTGLMQEFSLTHLTLPMLISTVENFRECNDPSFLLNTIRTVFTSVEALNESFRNESNNLDIASVRKAFQVLLELEPQETFATPLLNATEIHLITLESYVITPDEVSQLVILMENPLLHKSQDLLRKLCHVLNGLLPETRHALVKILSEYPCEDFQRLVKVLCEFLGGHVHPNQCTEPHLIEICKVVALFFDAFKHAQGSQQPMREMFPVSAFYCDELSKKLDFKKEYENWQIMKRLPGSSTKEHLSVLDFPFLLDPASKVRVMHIDAVWQMRVEYQNAIVHQARVQQVQRIFEETDKTKAINDCVKSAMCPFLVLEVRRDHLIRDTLSQINLKVYDLKKPLKIKYVGGGEQGLDMGGLQKEFFHMIVDSIFEPGYGMFTYVEESRTMWINGASFESLMEFELVGVVLGLAIYNGVILDVHFPPVIYKKLQHQKPTLQDLIGVQPSLGNSLRQLLEYEGDVEDTFCYTFQVSTVEYGRMSSHELIPNGADMPVTNTNRNKFVELYVQYLLVDSVAKQFEAFSKGFHKVCGGQTLTLFSPEELELLICGSPVQDFSELEMAAAYEDGYSAQHPTIRMLWAVFNEMSSDQKKALLMFVTGSDRVPLKGLTNLTFIIQKHGPDSDRLPSALTCFNRLLLPVYGDKDKLKERLVVAIENSKGFGLT